MPAPVGVPELVVVETVEDDCTSSADGGVLGTFSAGIAEGEDVEEASLGGAGSFAALTVL